MGSRIRLIPYAFVLLLVLASSVWAQTIVNPSFEYGNTGWTTYSYVPGLATASADPISGCIGTSGCAFDLLNPPTAPDGTEVCGIQSNAASGNGGVCQSFSWGGPVTTLSVTARNYSETTLGQPYNDGCLVRMALVSGSTTDRGSVTSWVTFPWSAAWTTRQITVPGPGAYTIFIEAYQPDAAHVISTLWDNVRFGDQITITSGPATAPNPSAPESAAIVTWTTDLPSTSEVDYGVTASYGHSVSSSELTTSHSIAITGLARTSRYHFRVKSASGDYVAESPDDVFNTPIQLIDLNVSLNEDNTQASISWGTDVLTSGQVEYWPDGGQHQTVTEPGPASYEHQVVLDVVVGKEYHFKATSSGTYPYTTVWTTGEFYTLPPSSSTLANGGFEGTEASGLHSLYPWVQYTAHADVPSLQAIDGLIGPYLYNGSDAWLAGIRAYDGSYFVGTQAEWDYKNGGVFQRVQVIPGQYYVLSARFITYRLGGENGYSTVRLGIDPSGGTDPSSTNIKWWSGYSDTNNSLWHTASLAAVAGPTGVATVFIEFRQRFSLQWHIGAADDVSFCPPAPISTGELKASQSSLGAVLSNKIVTYASPGPVWIGRMQYRKAYVEDDSRASGIAVLFPMSGTDFPVAGNKLTVTGALGEYNKEAAVLAEVWTVDHDTYALPKAVALPQVMIGTHALNQAPMFSNNTALCNIGLRVRVCGKVTWVSEEGSTGDVTAYIDDGGKISDASGHAGVRVYLPGTGTGSGIFTGDYVAATGVLGIEFIDPDNWPDPTDYYAFSLFLNSAQDWALTSASSL